MGKNGRNEKSKNKQTNNTVQREFKSLIHSTNTGVHLLGASSELIPGNLVGSPSPSRADIQVDFTTDHGLTFACPDGRSCYPKTDKKEAMRANLHMDQVLSVHQPVRCFISVDHLILTVAHEVDNIAPVPQKGKPRTRKAKHSAHLGGWWLDTPYSRGSWRGYLDEATSGGVFSGGGLEEGRGPCPGGQGCC